MVQGTNGDFYGTTYSGGTSDRGTVFKITPSGTLTTLYNFCLESDCTGGLWPFAGLVQATDGNFYGTTSDGGADFAGTVFRITPDGVLTTLHNFAGYPKDGSAPEAALVQDTNGAFYGTTHWGGTEGSACPRYLMGCGTVFGLSEGLSPFVKTEPTSGAVGRPVKILGSDLTGATSVTFNGTAATFTIVSPSLITTTVPAEATTGTVQVITPGGTLSSNVPFRVIQ